jgi:hypothetical protein
VVVPKKNGKLKFCVDFKKLNMITNKDPYPLPFINKVINIMANHEVYPLLDKFLGYCQIYIMFKDQHKIAFVSD